jgi:hypothetical protein
MGKLIGVAVDDAGVRLERGEPLGGSLPDDTHRPTGALDFYRFSGGDNMIQRAGQFAAQAGGGKACLHGGYSGLDCVHDIPEYVRIQGRRVDGALARQMP